MHEPRNFTVEVPPDRVRLHRLITDPEVGPDDYVANGFLGKERLWPKMGEDWATYFAISSFEEKEQAEAVAKTVNARLAKRGDAKPRWTHTQVFYVDGHMGHACAREGPPGHHSAWGHPDEFHSSGEPPLPIPSS
jgi:hypothetical protein